MFHDITGMTIEESLARKVLIDKLVAKPEGYEGSTRNADEVKDLKMMVSLINSFNNIFENLGEERIEIDITLPDYVHSCKLTINSPGLSKSVKLATNHFITSITIKGRNNLAGE